MIERMMSFLLAAAPMMALAENTYEQEQLQVHIKEIHSAELMAWYERGVDMTILDARGKKYLNGFRLPHAKGASLRMPDEALRAMIPRMDSLVVVYCSNIGCPASNWMTTRLVGLGFTNVFEYPEGIDGWMALGYPVDAINQ